MRSELKFVQLAIHSLQDSRSSLTVAVVLKSLRQSTISTKCDKNLQTEVCDFLVSDLPSICLQIGIGHKVALN